MKRLPPAVLTLLYAATALALAGGEDRPKEKKVVVNLGGLRSPVPADWVQEKPSHEMRLAQFRLPGVKGAGNGQLLVYRGIGGSVRDNIKRWQAQFTPPKGKTIDEVTTIRTIKIAGRPATYVDIRGTLKAGPDDKPVENYRRLAVQFQGPDKVYHLIVSGPAATLEHHKKGFDDWLKGFKKD
jgi:hypothetical protein